jgi:hypothetical protein
MTRDQMQLWVGPPPKNTVEEVIAACNQVWGTRLRGEQAMRRRLENALDDPALDDWTLDDWRMAALGVLTWADSPGIGALLGRQHTLLEANRERGRKRPRKKGFKLDLGVEVARVRAEMAAGLLERGHAGLLGSGDGA